MASRLGTFLAELKRRKVYHVAAAYVTVGVATSLGIPDLFGVFGLPASAARLVILVIAAGFPVALILAWIYELRREEPALDEAAPAPASGTAPAHGPRSIVVLPFENLSSDPEQEFFAAGMHDALITELAQIGALRVISRTSAMVYKERRVSVPEIARELNVDCLVEASVFRSGGTVRIQAQLIEAVPDERHLWAQSYTREMSDVLALHSEVAKAVAREVEVELTQQDESRLATARPVAPEAYELYLRGWFHLNKFTPEGFEQGLEYLNKAIEKDPSQGLAHAQLALGWVIIGHSPNSPPNALDKAEAAALKALELDDGLAEAHAALAEVRIYHDWDVEGAGRSFRRALELNPSLALTRGHYSWYVMLCQGHEAAVEEMRRARALDPLNPVQSAWLGWQLWFSGDLEEALVEAERCLELNPDFPLGNYVLGSVCTELGRFEEAVEAHKKAGAVSPMWGWGLGITYATAGRPDDAREVARQIEEDPNWWDTWCLAEIYAALDDPDRAIQWLEEAVKRRHSYIPWLNNFPGFDPLKKDPRFLELVERVGAPGA